MSQQEHPKFGLPVAAVRAWDFASTTKKKSDPTASCLMVATSKQYRVICDVTNKKLRPGERDDFVLAKAKQDGRRVQIVIEEEGGASGKDVIYHYTRLLSGYTVKAVRPSADKVLRAQGLASWFEQGLITYLPGAWNSAFIDQLTAFPNGDHDDMVDAASMAHNELDNYFVGRVSGVMASGEMTKPLDVDEIAGLPDGPLKYMLEKRFGL